jgi:hypothetical protein
MCDRDSVHMTVDVTIMNLFQTRIAGGRRSPDKLAKRRGQLVPEDLVPAAPTEASPEPRPTPLAEPPIAPWQIPFRQPWL